MANPAPDVKQISQPPRKPPQVMPRQRLRDVPENYGPASPKLGPLQGGLWKGHRLFAVDGSKLNLPRPLLQAGYKLPAHAAHYPQGLLSCLLYWGE